MAANEEKLTVKSLNTLIRNTIPEQAQKSKKPNENDKKTTLLFINRDFSACFPVNRYDEVYPGIYLGDQHLAFDKPTMARLGLTHVLNAAQGSKFTQIDTTSAYYDDLGLKFLGVQAMDTAGCKLCDHFQEAADFIRDALENNGKVYVHCFQGISRSATLVIVYLMQYKAMHLQDAITTVRLKRAVFPNDGFLKQLIALEEQLYGVGHGVDDSGNTIENDCDKI